MLWSAGTLEHSQYPPSVWCLCQTNSYCLYSASFLIMFMRVYKCAWGYTRMTRPEVSMVTSESQPHSRSTCFKKLYFIIYLFLFVCMRVHVQECGHTDAMRSLQKPAFPFHLVAPGDGLPGVWTPRGMDSVH